MQRSWLWAALLAFGCGQPREAVPTEPVPAAPRLRPTAILHPRPPSIPQLGALAERVYIRRSPRADSPEVGILHFGDRVELRSTEVSQGPGCDGGWLPVDPEGYVCLDISVTRQVDTHPLLKALDEYGANFQSATPYRWARSLGAPKYRRLATRAEQARVEYRLEEHLAALEKLRGGELSRVPRLLREVDASLAKAAPPSFMKTLSPWSAVHTPQDERPLAGHVPARSSVAYTRQVTRDGRSFLLTNELLLVPKDKVVLQEPSHYAGVHLDGRKQRLPLAFIRREPRPKYRFVDAPVQPASVGSPGRGQFTQTGEQWPRLGWVGLTGRERLSRSVRYLETRERGLWIAADDATVVDSQPPRGFSLDDGEKWLDISIFRGTLVAYEGRRAIFASLVSPGANGYRRVDGEPAKYTTPTGTFRIEWKHRSTTMSPDPERKSYYLAEVPFAQFFHMPFALHAAYWHDDFGEPKSGGCVNLSPEDARWLFDWTDPPLPDGWHSVRSGDGRGDGTWVRIR